jgi:hypothetical protein
VQDLDTDLVKDLREDLWYVRRSANIVLRPACDGHHAFDCRAVLGAVNASALRADRAWTVRGFGH